MRGAMMAVGVVVAVAVLLLVGMLLSIELGLSGSEEYVAGAPMTEEHQHDHKTDEGQHSDNNLHDESLPISNLRSTRT